MPHGFNQTGDIISVTADGRPLNAIWDEAQEAARLANELRSVTDSLLTRNITAPAEDVIASVGDEELDVASEFGEPTGIKSAPKAQPMGAMFKWLDKAGRFTWQYLVTATADQVSDTVNRLFEADSKTTHKSVFGAVFNSVTRTNELAVPVYPLYNGDSIVPPPYNGVTFTAPHSHYFASNAAVLDSGDVEQMIDAILEHGHSVNDGGQIVVLANRAHVDLIRTWRAGVTNANSAVAKYDFVPAAGGPSFFTAEQLIGGLAPSKFNGLDVSGSYGDALVVQSFHVPTNYILAVAVYGSNSPRNAVSFREHAQASLRGFRLVKGRTPDYPLVDSFYVRGFGTGVRFRGAAAVTEVTVGATYDAPAVFATGVY